MRGSQEARSGRRSADAASHATKLARPQIAGRRSPLRSSAPGGTRMSQRSTSRRRRRRGHGMRVARSVTMASRGTSQSAVRRGSPRAEFRKPPRSASAPAMHGGGAPPRTCGRSSPPPIPRRFPRPSKATSGNSTRSRNSGRMRRRGGSTGSGDREPVAGEYAPRMEREKPELGAEEPREVGALAHRPRPLDEQGEVDLPRRSRDRRRSSGCRGTSECGRGGPTMPAPPRDAPVRSTSAAAGGSRGAARGVPRVYPILRASSCDRVGGAGRPPW